MVAELVARQHGVVAAWQLAECGFTKTMIRRRLEAGRLYRVQSRVFSLTARVLPRGRMMAAVLTHGQKAVLSHRAAAAVWDLGPWPTGAVDVTVPTRRRARRGVRLHRARVPRVMKDGFPVTTVSRTLIDLAAVLPLGRLRDAFEKAERLGLLDVNRVNEEMPGRRGARKIRAILADHTEPEPTRSELEKAFRALCREHGIPLPSQNVHLLGYEVDALWETDKTVVELDGWEFHKTRKSFEEDRRGAAALEAAGYRVLRFTWRQVTRDRETVARAIRPSRARAARRGGSSASRR